MVKLLLVEDNEINLDMITRRLKKRFEIAIARTLPQYGGQQEVREVEALFCDMIASAEGAIYIENQFLTSNAMAQALARRLKDKPELEALVTDEVERARSHDGPGALRLEAMVFVQSHSSHESDTGEQVKKIVHARLGNGHHEHAA